MATKDSRQIAEQIIAFYNEYDLKVSGRIHDQTAYQLLEDIETRFPVDSIQIADGTRLWNLLRIFLYSNFQHLGDQTGPGTERMEMVRSFLSTFKEGLQPLRLPRTTVYGFSSSESRKLYNETYYDIYLDPLYDVLDDNLTVCEWPQTSGIRRDYDHPLYSRHYVPMHFPLWSKTFWDLLFHQLTRRQTFRIESQETLEQVIEYISTTAAVDKSRLRRNLYDFIAVFVYVKDFLTATLSDTKPRMVLIRCGYGRFPMALAQACRKLHIPSVEIQHGLITKYLPAYRRTQQTTNHDCVPEYLLAHGDIYADLVRTGNLFSPDKVFATGYPYLAKKLQEKPNDAAMKSQYTPYARNILFTSQWIVAREVQEFVTEVSERLDALKLDIGILFKPHPYDKTKYEDWRHPTNLILINKYEDTFRLFGFVDLHSTVYSTSGLEAMAFGTPNIFLDLFHLTPSADTPYIVSTPEAFIASTKQIFEDYAAAVKETTQIADLFFTPNPQQRFQEFFQHHGV